MDAASGRVPDYAGTGANTTREAMALTLMAEQSGVDAISAITPSLISPGQDELYDQYQWVAAATKLPILLSSNPARTGSSISASLAAKLSHVENVVGIKNSSGDLSLTSAYIAATSGGFKAFATRDTLIFDTLLYGRAGAAATTADVAAKQIVRTYEAYPAGDISLARTVQAELIPVREAFSPGAFPAVIKETLTNAGPGRPGHADVLSAH